MLGAFYQDLAQRPDDWALRGVMADWCDDNRLPAVAECLRWMVQHHKRPHLGTDQTFSWFDAAKIEEGLGDPESDVPGPVYKKIKGGQESAHHKTFLSLREAEEAFQTAWAAARKRGWSGAG